MKNYNKTIKACYASYIVQAIVNNFAPLLFLTFQKQFDISLTKITLLITFNFLFQLFIDIASVGFVDKIGYRLTMIIAHIMASIGLTLIAFLPFYTKDPFIGLFASVIVYAIGGGLLEVVGSPIVEACPSEHKEATMSLLHSFYCWGQVLVVLLSTLFFYFAGIQNWRILACIWALFPLINMFQFINTPMPSLLHEEDKGMTLRELFGSGIFWMMLLMMICAGASELAMSQWASTYAEKALGISKTLGDLTGPMFFAVCMGIARLFYGKYGKKIVLEKFMLFSALLCVIAYLMASLAQNPIVGLLGCGIAGFSVGIMWPGTYSTSSANMPRGGTAMFALLAFAGDLGCSSGPTLVGLAAGLNRGNLQTGLFTATIFPIMMLILLVCIRIHKRHKNNPLT